MCSPYRDSLLIEDSSRRAALPKRYNTSAFTAAFNLKYWGTTMMWCLITVGSLTAVASMWIILRLPLPKPHLGMVRGCLAFSLLLIAGVLIGVGLWVDG
jgi:hypothetical protein